VPPIVPFIDRIALTTAGAFMALDVNGKRRPIARATGVSSYASEPKSASLSEELSTLLDDSLPLLYEHSCPARNAGT